MADAALKSISSILHRAISSQYDIQKAQIVKGSHLFFINSMHNSIHLLNDLVYKLSKK